MKSIFIKTKNWFGRHMPTKRRLIQLYCALLFNANLKGYITGSIFKGATKNFCTPGLNCYSCPGAVTSCPMGALQNAFASSDKRTPYYIFGILLLYSLMLGRWICGYICPFGLIQDLLHKIKTPKLKKNRVTKVLSYFKYVVLVVFAIILPLIYMLQDMPLPAFCKYICPAGTLGGAVALLINPANETKFGMLGDLFTWKFVLMIGFVVGAIFIYRVFCRFVCPLGAIYGLFNRFALFGIKLERDKCIDCGKCITKCKMDITHVGDTECINCGECISVCPTKAISWRGGRIILPENEIQSAKDEEQLKTIEAKREKRVKIIRTVTASIMAVVLAGALVYYNFIEKPNESVVGAEVGDECYSYDLEIINGDGTINIDDLEGKVVVINFWGTWCGPCVQELPHFNEVASEYKDEVIFIVVHSTLAADTAEAYVNANFAETDMIFVYDLYVDGEDVDHYFGNLGGTECYPRTLVLDRNGIIAFTIDGSLEYEELVDVVENAIINN